MIYVVAEQETETNGALVNALTAVAGRAALADARAVCAFAKPGDVAIGRVDVLPDVSGCAHGLADLRRLESRGVVVVNRADALLAAHDKLQTALRFDAHGVPQPATVHVDETAARTLGWFPVVLKPRFGSWGRDVFRVRSEGELEDVLDVLRRRSWFSEQGAIAQEYVETNGRDVRALVCRGTVIGGIARTARAGEWRTNVALGATRAPIVPDLEAQAVAVGAAAALDADLVAVDLVRCTKRGWLALEVNGAAEFTPHYSFPGDDVFVRAAELVAAVEAEADAAAAEPAVAAAAGSSPLRLVEDDAIATAAVAGA